MKISKIDAARRQLVTAITLFFNSGDQVAIHTLTAAAFRVTRDLCDTNPTKYESATTMVQKAIKPEYLPIFWKKVHESANFFKHADNDSSEIHEFEPYQTEYIIFFTIWQYRSLTGENVPHMLVFLLWFMLEHPEGFNMPPQYASIARTIDHENKPSFFKDTLMAIQLAEIT